MSIQASPARRTPPDLKALRARKRREWSSLKAGESVEIMIDLGQAYALETRGTAKRASSMQRNADLAVQTIIGCEIVGMLTMKDPTGSRFPARKCVIRDGKARLDGPEWYCEHDLTAFAPF